MKKKGLSVLPLKGVFNYENEAKDVKWYFQKASFH